jgi:hypothetical protein
MAGYSNGDSAAMTSYPSGAEWEGPEAGKTHTAKREPKSRPAPIMTVINIA